MFIREKPDTRPRGIQWLLTSNTKFAHGQPLSSSGANFASLPSGNQIAREELYKERV
ncbi:MAG: hypothetical protein RR212_01980 [Bacteroidales bacterium]